MACPSRGGNRSLCVPRVTLASREVAIRPPSFASCAAACSCVSPLLCGLSAAQYRLAHIEVEDRPYAGDPSPPTPTSSCKVYFEENGKRNGTLVCQPLWQVMYFRHIVAWTSE